MKIGVVAGGDGCVDGLVDVIAAVVRVPEFHERAALDGIAAGVEDAPINILHRAGRRRGVVVDVEQIVVLGQRHRVGRRVIRPLRAKRCGVRVRGQNFGQITGQREPG